MEKPTNHLLVQCKDLRKTFNLPGGGDYPVLKGIDLELRAGEFVTLMGPSGSGKSTLLNIIGGLIPATGGVVKVNGKPLSDMNHAQLTEVRRWDVGWIFQDFNLIENLTAIENVMIPMNLAGVTGEEARARAEALLETVELRDRADHFPDTLSGGQQQRVAIARAIVNEPPLILADEPTGNLDTATGLEIIAFFQQLVKGGKGILMVTHDHNLARASQRVYVIRNGRLVESIGNEKNSGPRVREATTLRADRDQRRKAVRPTLGLGPGEPPAPVSFQKIKIAHGKTKMEAERTCKGKGEGKRVEGEL